MSVWAKGMSEKSDVLSRLKNFPVSSSRWPDLEALFGERGACGGCWCMAWRLPSGKFRDGKGDTNKRAFRNLVSSGGIPGILGYLGHEPIAWCSIEPRQKFVFLANSRVLKPVDDQLVWSISCLFVKKPYRRRGISAQMLRAAVEFASEQGAQVVEGYPVEPTMKKTPDPFVWTGIYSAFRAAGFKEVARRSKSRPIMRFQII
jgi:GNAT superfamily N-acetyltransferase